MKEARFNQTRFADIMSHQGYLELDNRVQNRQKFPPNHRLSTVGYFRSSGANLLTAVCIYWLKSEGIFCYRNSSQGISRKVKGKVIHTPNKGMKGSADIYSMIGGATVWIEVKFRKDVQSDAQKKFQKEIERSGGLYWMVRTFDQFLTLYKTHISTIPEEKTRVLNERGSTAFEEI